MMLLPRHCLEIEVNARRMTRRQLRRAAWMKFGRLPPPDVNLRKTVPAAIAQQCAINLHGVAAAGEAWRRCNRVAR